MKYNKMNDAERLRLVNRLIEDLPRMSALPPTRRPSVAAYAVHLTQDRSFGPFVRDNKARAVSPGNVVAALTGPYGLLSVVDSPFFKNSTFVNKPLSDFFTVVYRRNAMTHTNPQPGQNAMSSPSATAVTGINRPASLRLQGTALIAFGEIMRDLKKSPDFETVDASTVLTRFLQAARDLQKNANPGLKRQLEVLDRMTEKWLTSSYRVAFLGEISPWEQRELTVAAQRNAERAASANSRQQFSRSASINEQGLADVRKELEAQRQINQTLLKILGRVNDVIDPLDKGINIEIQGHLNVLHAQLNASVVGKTEPQPA